MRSQRGRRPQLKLRTSQGFILPNVCSGHRRAYQLGWRSLQIHPSENIRRNIPSTKPRDLGLDHRGKVYDRIRRGGRNVLDRILRKGFRLGDLERGIISRGRIGPRSCKSSKMPSTWAEPPDSWGPEPAWRVEPAPIDQHVLLVAISWAARTGESAAELLSRDKGRLQGTTLLIKDLIFPHADRLIARMATGRRCSYDQ